MFVIISLLLGFIAGIIIGSFVEHAVHKYFLHNTPKFLRKNTYVKSMFRGHVVSHHSTYLPDDHYTQDDTNKAEVLTFSWYEGPLLILAATILIYWTMAAIRLLLGKFEPIMPEVVGASTAFALYYCAYEGLHVLMHVPKKMQWLRRTRVLVWMNRHHYQHHVNPSCNLNVILPIADYVWQTRRSLPKEQYVYADALPSPDN